MKTTLTNHKKNIPLLLLLISTLHVSCRKFIEIEPPRTQLVTETAFKDDATANSVIAGMYSQMYHLNTTRSTFGAMGVTIQPGLSADELQRPDAPSDPFFTNNLLSDNADVGRIWSSCYNVIFMANDAIERLTVSTSITPAFRNQLLGEALFIRAFSHFYLANLFGDVPLILTTHYAQSALLGRTKKDSVYLQITADLIQAKQLTVADYSTYFAGERVRANKFVVSAFLARVYLYDKKYTLAMQEASYVINTTTLFKLETADLNAVFLRNSREAIFQFISYGGMGATYLGNLFNPSTATSRPAYILTAGLLKSFESGDLRLAKWTKANTVNATVFTFPYKYKHKFASLVTSLEEYDMAMRLPEQYLIRAEAYAYLDRIPEALTDINVVRNRAGLGNVTATVRADVLDKIEMEKRHEFFAEWGHRWFDLKRTSKATAVLGAAKPNWKATAELFPIPALELNKNPNLFQNPGYK